MRMTHMLLLGLMLGTGLSLGACDSLDNLTNMLDTKKRLSGDRRPVFPDGVPGVEMGVPPEMMKGYQEKQQQAEGQAQTPPGAPAAARAPASSGPTGCAGAGGEAQEGRHPAEAQACTDRYRTADEPTRSAGADGGLADATCPAVGTG